MSKSKKFKRPKVFSKSNLTVVILAALGLQAYPNFNNSQSTIESNSDVSGESASDKATIIENQIADNFNGRMPCQVSFTDSNIVIKIPKVDIFSFTRNYIPYTLDILRTVKNAKLPNSLKNIKLSVGDNTEIFSLAAIKKANFSKSKIQEFNVGEITSNITKETYENYYKQYLSPLIIKQVASEKMIQKNKPQ